MARHPDTDLVPYLRGELPPAERERVARHLEECPDCKQDAEVLRDLLESQSPLLRPCRNDNIGNVAGLKCRHPKILLVSNIPFKLVRVLHGESSAGILLSQFGKKRIGCGLRTLSLTRSIQIGALRGGRVLGE